MAARSKKMARNTTGPMTKKKKTFVVLDFNYRACNCGQTYTSATAAEADAKDHCQEQFNDTNCAAESETFVAQIIYKVAPVEPVEPRVIVTKV